MTFEAIEEDSSVFIDANVLIYHFVGASPQCTALVRRCETGGLRGFTSVLVLAEVCHRLMTMEAVEKKLVSARNVPRKLASRPDLIRQLVTYETAMESIPVLRIEVIAVTEATFTQSLRFQKRFGLLTNDSLIVASMILSGLAILATADRRLAAVNEIEIALPTDLNGAG